MDQIKDKVASVAAATTEEGERECLIGLRNALAAAGASFAVHLRKDDGSEVNLATSQNVDPDGLIVFVVHHGGDSWTSEAFPARKLANYYVLFRE